MPNPISTDFNNADLLRRISEGGVSFVLGGGAVAAYGCRADLHVPELDILIDPSIDNAQRVLAVLSAAGMQLWIGPTDLAGPKKQLPLSSYFSIWRF